MAKPVAMTDETWLALTRCLALDAPVPGSSE
jgi:hypothetical protein